MEAFEGFCEVSSSCSCSEEGIWACLNDFDPFFDVFLAIEVTCSVNPEEVEAIFDFSDHSFREVFSFGLFESFLCSFYDAREEAVISEGVADRFAVFSFQTPFSRGAGSFGGEIEEPYFLAHFGITFDGQ